jgi:hypothetical protein
MYKSHWPHGVRRRSAAARLLRCELESHRGHGCLLCVVLSGWGLWDELIPRPEESYRVWCVVVCDLETSKEEVLAHWELLRPQKKVPRNRLFQLLRAFYDAVGMSDTKT